MTGIMPERFNSTSAPMSFLNIGGPLRVDPLPAGYLVGRSIFTGETLEVAGEEPDASSVREALAAYPDLVPVGSPRAVAFELLREARETLALAHIADEEARRAEVAAQAEAWLTEHDVPDFVVEYMRGDD